jgi:beta-galactosidase beta subunit
MVGLKSGELLPLSFVISTETNHNRPECVESTNKTIVKKTVKVKGKV